MVRPSARGLQEITDSEEKEENSTWVEKPQTKAIEGQTHRCADGGRENKRRVPVGGDEEEELASLPSALTKGTECIVKEKEMARTKVRRRHLTCAAASRA